MNRLVARLVVATRKIDAAHGRFDAARSALLAGFLSDATLDHINDIAYASDERYRRDRVGFMSYLFPVEEAVWREFLPPPPARLLVGGAGGGREVAALVERGYEVVAFEPSEALAESLAEWGLEHVQVYRGAYEQLPFLRAVPDGQRVDIRDLGPFDAGLLGWGSFSHLRHEEHRVATLRAFGELTGGPVIASFLRVRSQSDFETRGARLRRRLPQRAGRTLDDRFSVYIGHFHPVDESEVRTTAQKAGMEVVLAAVSKGDRWPHAVVRRRADPLGIPRDPAAEGHHATDREVPAMNRAVARLVRATRAVNAAYRGFDAARSVFLAAVLSDRTLDHINDLAYGSDDRYHHNSSDFETSLFPWEHAVVRDVFPPAPARVLVGGAGGGREVAALVERGYEVVAFEPSEALAESLAEWGLEHVQVYRGAYEQLPFLRAVPDGQRVDIRDLGPFDAGLLGWGSFSHLRHEEHRVATLRAFGELTGGPVLVSFVGLRTGRRGANTRARLSCVRLPRREGRHPADRFSILMGFYHPTNQPEFEATARRAGMEVELAVFETRDIVVWPHVVIRRKENSGSGQEHDAVRPGASG